MWRPIPGFDGYEVSDVGEVRSWRPISAWASVPTEPRLLQQSSHAKGYRNVSLGTGTRLSTTRPVHRLVLEAFVGPRPVGMECRHLNGNRSDNRLANLCWGTSLDNSRDRRVHGTIPSGAQTTAKRIYRGSENASARLSEDKVRAIRASSESHRVLAQRYGVSSSTIGRVKRGEHWKAA